MVSRPDARARRRVPLVLLPWLVYVGVTVVAPAANGAAAGERFAEHAVITLGVSGAVLMLWLAAARSHRARRGTAWAGWPRRSRWRPMSTR